MTTQLLSRLLAALLLFAAPVLPHAQPAGSLRLDQRYHHDHYYPAAGSAVRVLPSGSTSIGWQGGTWYFHAGVWFRPAGARFVVAVPPAGIEAPYLPPSSVPLWIGGAPYYYANGTYYAPANGGFAVVRQPPGADAAQPVDQPPLVIVYPRQGQTAAQTDTDRGTCNEWAASQGVALDPVLFQRAFEACMEGRGYTVR